MIYTNEAQGRGGTQWRGTNLFQDSIATNQLAKFLGRSRTPVGMVGQIWASTQEQVHAWKSIGPREVLRNLGVIVGEGKALEGLTADEVVAGKR